MRCLHIRFSSTKFINKNQELKSRELLTELAKMLSGLRNSL